MTVEEFNTSVDLYSDSLYRFILKNIKDTDKAHDIVQDTYEKLWLKVSDVESTNVKSYVFTVGYRTMLDVIKRDKKRVDISEAKLHTKGNENKYSDLKQILNEALNKLPEIQRSVILLRDYEGYEYKEIADITGITLDQVKVYIYRARIFLKNYIGAIENVV